MMTANEVRAVTRAIGDELSKWRASILDHVKSATAELAPLDYVDKAQSETLKDARDIIDEEFEVRFADYATADETDALIETALAGEREKTSETIRAEVSDAIRSAVDPLAGTIAETLRGDAKLRGETGPQGRDGVDGLGLDASPWASGVYREGAVVSHHIGQVFRANRDTVDEPGESDAWSRLGSCGFRMASPYREGIAYRSGDLFVRDRSLFLMTDDGPTLAVGRGKPGERGERGERGEDGAEIDVIELRGLDLAFVFRRGDELSTASVDLSPLVDLVARRVVSLLAREEAAS